jgi:hypothetical protein
VEVGGWVVGVAVIARVKSSKRVPVMRPGHRVNSSGSAGTVLSWD